ncbi:chemotaxis protein CheB [Flavobacterium pallidum]|uniref:protein-glutamate methylesterase n=1 Tax=Flavobacterium pallidum TaxID=2172098 RepID=A0A2S1SI89_9FLAO|nr:chemotaxis protein CheB [Flavobacterium pallidum]AWI26105.1 chemotaxis protein CheB [Flavobacterium pallidum]
MEETQIIRTKVVVMGGSAGSLEVLLKILPRIAIIPDFAIAIVLHRKNSEDNTLEELIALKTMIPVVEIEDKTPLLPGAIYICPSDYHLLFEKNGTLSLDISEKVNYSRPSIDLAFESAADAYGDALTGILLSGANADGTAGLKAIKELGGTTIVQNPETADMPFMPRNALQFAEPHFSLDANEILEYIKGV